MPSLRFVLLAVLAIIGVLFSGQISMVSSQEECGGEITALILECAAYVRRGSPLKDPSKGCCEAINKVDIPCACKHVTKEVEQMVDMSKVIHVVEYCGRPVPPGMKCGSYVVPPLSG